MGMGPLYWTSLSTGLSKWGLGPRHTEQSPLLNDRSRGYLQNCCYSKQLSMALLHASHPPSSDLWG